MGRGRSDDSFTRLSSTLEQGLYAECQDYGRLVPVRTHLLAKDNSLDEKNVTLLGSAEVTRS